MKISVNGEIEILEKALSLSEYLDTKNIESGRYVVAVDQAFVPKSQYASFTLQDGHQLDILIAMQGG